MALSNCSSTIQESLLNLNSRQAKYTVTTGAIDLALSAENGAEITTKMIRKDGKNSKYYIEYPTALCEAVVDCDVFDCEASVDAPMTSCLDITGFDCFTTSWIKIGVDEWRDLGSVTPTQIFQSQLMDQMNKLMIEVDKAAIVAACAGAGCIETVTTTKELKLMVPTTGVPYWASGDEINLDFSDAGYETNPLLLGGRQLYSFAKAQGRVGLNQDGLNLASLPTFDAFYDKNMVAANCAPATPGNDPLLAFMPGVFNLINWSSFSGIFATREDSIDMNNYQPEDIYKGGPGHERAMLMHPSKNWMFDFEIKFRDTDCAPTIYWRLKTYYKAVVLPVLGCKDDCFTGIIKYDVCPVPAVAC